MQPLFKAFLQASAVGWVLVKVSTPENSSTLWDGAGCGPDSTCCSLNNPPYFYKDLSYTTSTDIEMRVCRDEGSGNEDIAIRNFEFYVQ